MQVLIRLALGEGEEALAMLERASAAPGSAPLVVGTGLIEKAICSKVSIMPKSARTEFQIS